MLVKGAPDEQVTLEMEWHSQLPSTCIPAHKDDGGGGGCSGVGVVVGPMVSANSYILSNTGRNLVTETCGLWDVFPPHFYVHIWTSVTR